MDKENRFQTALLKYLRQVDMYTIRKETELTRSGKYRNLCFMKTFYKDEDKKPYRLLVPTDAWHELLREVDQIFESKIKGKLTHRAIDRTICELQEFPFSEETLIQHSKDIFAMLWWHFELQVEALVPLYNIRCTGHLELPLANTVLYSGNSESILARKASHPDLRGYGGEADVKDNSFLCIPVTGDDESRLAQVELESEQALKVLRFVTFWQSATKGNKRTKVNLANFVSLWKTDTRRIFYHKPDESDDRTGLYSDIQSKLVIDERDVDAARQHLGLDDINYHYQNPDNPSSDRVRRALELYDSGTRALTNWQALYRYVACINVALPTSSSQGKELAQHLETLIKYGGNYIGTMKKDSSLSDPNTTTWDSMVRMTAEPFAQFYMLRGKILHGNPMSDDEISDTDIEDVRILAHNAVRLLAKVSREFQWQNYKEAKNWFKTPDYPPSVKTTDEE